MASVGVHCICELYGCRRDLIDDHAFVQRVLREAAEVAGATWIGEVSHRFTPHGVTALGLLSESHISVHTWPEVGYVAADCFTCGDVAIPEKACRYLAEAFGAERATVTSIPRATALRPAEVRGVDPDAAHMSHSNTDHSTMTQASIGPEQQPGQQLCQESGPASGPERVQEPNLPRATTQLHREPTQVQNQPAVQPADQVAEQVAEHRVEAFAVNRTGSNHNLITT